jgi:hypothetical protein
LRAVRSTVDRTRVGTAGPRVAASAMAVATAPTVNIAGRIHRPGAARICRSNACSDGAAGALREQALNDFDRTGLHCWQKHVPAFNTVKGGASTGDLFRTFRPRGAGRPSGRCAARRAAHGSRKGHRPRAALTTTVGRTLRLALRATDTEDRELCWRIKQFPGTPPSALSPPGSDSGVGEAARGLLPPADPHRLCLTLERRVVHALGALARADVARLPGQSALGRKPMKVAQLASLPSR